MWFIEYIYLAIILAISIGLHEYAHAVMSNYLWDPTPKLQNRLTPNPLAHIDPIWFLLIFIIRFGRWKPVIVDPRYYKNPIRDELLVSLAWPATNIILWILWIIIIYLFWKFWTTATNGIEILNINWNIILDFWQMFSIINFSLAVFNLIPLPPLDWYRLIKFFKPSWWYYLEKNQLYILPIFIIILITWWQYISLISYYLFWLFYMLFEYLIF